MEFSLAHNAWTNVTDEAVGSAMLFEKEKVWRHDERVIRRIEHDVRFGAKTLDWGCGIGLIAGMLHFYNYPVEAYDKSPVMRQRTAERIGAKNVHDTILTIREGAYDIILCNLVVCIIPDDDEVRQIFRHLRRAAGKNAKIIISFCNPKICRVSKTAIDFRYFPEGANESSKILFNKRKREEIPDSMHYGYYTDPKGPGPTHAYIVTEVHRPIDRYLKMLEEEGLRTTATFFSYPQPGDDPQVEDYAFIECTPA